MLKKYFKNYLIIWVLFVAIYLAACFLTPNTVEGYYKFGGAFWGPFVIIMIALVGQLIIAKKVFDSETKEKLFMNLPLYRLSYLGTVLTFIVGTVCMVIPDLPNWIGSILCGVILVLTYMSLTVGQGVSSRIQEKEALLKEFTGNMRNLVSQAKLLAENAPEEKKDAINKVYEALKYSDVVSCPESQEIENQISDMLNELSADNWKEASESLLDLISKRNEIVKRSK